ncbi:hypothetical protein CCP2SC5_70060 [Azospirillaceae bacterium]
MGPGTVFMVVGDHKGGAIAPIIREAIFLWNRLLLFSFITSIRYCYHYHYHYHNISIFLLLVVY